MLYGVAGFIAGFFLGIGAALFYLKWKMQKQLGDIEDQMEAVMDLTSETSDMMPNMDEDLVEEKEEKED